MTVDRLADECHGYDLDGNRLPNSVEVYVQDAVGGIYCHSCGDLAYEAASVKHARWWTRQRASRIRACAPFKVIVKRYFDESAA